MENQLNEQQKIEVAERLEACKDLLPDLTTDYESEKENEAGDKEVKLFILHIYEACIVSLGKTIHFLELGTLQGLAYANIVQQSAEGYFESLDKYLELCEHDEEVRKLINPSDN